MSIDWAFVQWREDAIRGSENLRNAILRSKGHPIPDGETRIRHRKMVTKPTTRHYKPKKALPPVEAHCPCCHSPLAHKRRMIADIKQTVSTYFGCSADNLSSETRRREITHARQVAMYLASELTSQPIAEIGRRFNRDHTTVLHAIKAVNLRAEQDPECAYDVALLRERLAA